MSSEQDLDEQIQEWCDNVRNESVSTYMQDVGTNNFVEITRIPRKIDSRTMTSMVVSASKIVPGTVRICNREDDPKVEPVALIKFKSESDAFKAVDRLKKTVYGRSWNMKIMKNPELDIERADF